MFRVAPFREYHEAGFTIIEVLVALAIVAASLASIGALIATSTRWSHVLERHVELIETARAVKSALPKHDQLAIGDFSGELAGHSWRVNVLPFAAGGIDPELPSPWLPRTIAITVRSPTGAAFQLTTVRLHRRTKE